ncbi:hypothetical protein C8R45DRAFT_943026 [Mycena sanguinolenta]|nr:hypothetical protein C8R45DRAFT_943026 [Mycena sanguinolenta]
MAPCVESGHEILVPLFSTDSAESLVHINWQQNFAQRKADYYALTVDNITTGETVPFFIAAEYYKNSTKANAHHITKVAELVDGEGYKMKVDSKLQYGQKNAQGELRFVVYHDQEHKPYQVSFIAVHVFCTLASASSAALSLYFPPSRPASVSRSPPLPAIPTVPARLPFFHGSFPRPSCIPAFPSRPSRHSSCSTPPWALARSAAA